MIPATLVDTLAGRYRIERELGAGGMATVYLARDLKHDRLVALKVLKPDLAASLGHERFLKEITTTANLRHPHILPLYDSGESDGFVYYVMPFVDGETLRQRIEREGQLPLADARRIAREVADALSYAHARGVVHRDVKPENILLEGEHAIVADFGIARAATAAGTAGATSLTQTGTAIGTPAYMSPEQAAGEQNLDGRSDLYALGCVTYEMLTGHPPFAGPTAASIVHQHLAAAPRSVTELRPAVPASFDRALERALAKNPSDRFDTPAAFAAALDAQLAPRAPRVSRRALGAVAVVVVALAAGAWALRGGSASDTRLDTGVIAVLPFRVGAGDQSIAYLRESMLDLLQARLSSSAGPRIVEPRTMLAAWRRTVKSDRDDLSEDASRALARTVGAGRVLLGSVVATPTELTLGGTLLRVADGRVLARESVVGRADSVAALVNRLTAALLIREAGESGDRSTGLSAAPLDALQDYLAGRKASRRGDYFGAMDLYGRAFARDSTFAAAAFAMASTNAFIGNVFRKAGFEVIPRLSRIRNRLSARDLSLFLALPMVGPNYPRPSTMAETIAQAERAANAAPDSPEHWLLVGLLLSFYGPAADRADWAERSAAALDRAIGLDSSFTLAIGARLFTAIAARDRDATARFSKLLESRVASGFTDDVLLWAAARATGDGAAAIRWRNRAEKMSRTDYMQKLVVMSLHSVAFRLPLDDARWAADTLRREAVTLEERIGETLGRLAVRFAAGKLDLGNAQLPVESSQWEAGLIQQALIEPAYRPLAADILAQLAAGKYGVPTSGGSVRWPPTEDCSGALFRVTGGDTTGAAESIRHLQAFAASEHPPISNDDWQQTDFRVCPLLLQVLLEGRPAPHETRPALDRLDSLMRQDPRGFMGSAGFAPTPLANLTIARMREAQGDIAGALAAARRREVDYFPAYVWSLPAFLRQEGRLAALAGDTTAAARAYDEYLRLRTDPDAPFRAQRDSVVNERAALSRLTHP